MTGMLKLCRACCSRASASSTRLLDDILRFGSQPIFSDVLPGRGLSQQALTAEDDSATDRASADPAADAQGHAMHDADASQQSHGYSDDILDALVQRTDPRLMTEHQQVGNHSRPAQQMPMADTKQPKHYLGNACDGLCWSGSYKILTVDLPDSQGSAHLLN